MIKQKRKHCIIIQDKVGEREELSGAEVAAAAVQSEVVVEKNADIKKQL